MLGQRKHGFATSVAVLASALLAGTAAAAELTIEFSAKGAREGLVFVSLYSNAADWMKKPLRQARVPVNREAALAVFSDLPPGEYAASAFFDRNGNGMLDTNFFKVPNEPYGFSNGASGSFGPPTFDQARIRVGADKSAIAVTLK